MSTININTATKEELMKGLRDIGSARATAIVETREKEGPLDLEKLKNIPNIPAHMWDPLVAANKITFELPSGEKEESDLEHLKKLVEKYKTENIILSQAELRQKMELQKLTNDYKNTFDDMTAEINALTKQNELMGIENKRKKQELERYVTMVKEYEGKEYSITEEQMEIQNKMELQKRIYQEETEGLKQSNSELKDACQIMEKKLQEQNDHINRTSEQNIEQVRQIKDLEFKVNGLMKKLRDNSLDKFKAEELAQLREKETREQEMRIKTLEEEVRHWKTKNAVDELAPKTYILERRTVN